ncbi:hypothetical protein BKA61DRAFT_663115 [Leptodontidium sp. MPI-SDFR-AT-0119]|nr:hypothetical protein BKA61DRAFT_663115 [Leptodontidium sp. MPI-SDFR-AT-0119]
MTELAAGLAAGGMGSGVTWRRADEETSRRSFSKTQKIVALSPCRRRSCPSCWSLGCSRPWDGLCIPLPTTVRTASSTGARKASDEAMIQEPTIKDSEKKGLFNRGVSSRREGTNLRKRSSTDSEEVSVNRLRRFYNKIVNFSIITRYFVYVLPAALLLAAPIVVFAILNPHAIFANTGVRVTLCWLWIEIFWLSIWVPKLVAKAVP